MARPEIGHGIKEIVKALVEKIELFTGVPCEYQPVLIGAQETTLILVPSGFEIEHESKTRAGNYEQITAILKLQSVLTGEGVSDEFLAETMEASLKISILFREPVVVPVASNFNVIFSATPSAKGRYYSLEEEGFVYEEVWDGNLYFPLTVFTKPDGFSLEFLGWKKEIKTGGA